MRLQDQLSKPKLKYGISLIADVLRHTSDNVMESVALVYTHQILQLYMGLKQSYGAALILNPEIRVTEPCRSSLAHEPVF